MSAIGRIFLILNLVLAAVFLGYASNQLSQISNFSAALTAERDAHAATKKSLNEKAESLTSQLNQTKTDLSAVRDERDTQKGLADRNGQDLAQEKEANAQLRGELTGIRETLGGYNATIASLNDQKDRLVGEKEAAVAARDAANDAKDQADAARRDAETKLVGANNQISTLELAVAKAEKQLSATQTELAQVYAVTGASKVGAAQALVEGAVIQIDNSITPGLLAINKGKNDGVTRGTVFELYSGNAYKGRAKVETVRDDVCSAIVILKVDGKSIAQGDRATTQL